MAHSIFEITLNKNSRRLTFHTLRVVVLVLIMSLLVSACEDKYQSSHDFVATPEKPALSPSGKFILAVLPADDEKVHAYRFQIRDPMDHPLFTSQDRFMARHRTYFLWDQADRIWVYSGDVGTFFWELKNDTAWEKRSWVDNRQVIDVPAFLKKTIKRFRD